MSRVGKRGFFFFKENSSHTNILPEYSHPISMSDLTFNLFDLEDAVERSVAVCLSVPPPVGLNSLRSRSGCYVDFAASDTPSFFEERPKLKEQSESSTEEDQLLFHSSEADRGVGLCSLPALYVLDHTHLRLRTADSLALSSVDHPLDAVVRAQSLLPQQFSSINCDCQVVRSKSKMKGILFSGREHVDFRIHCFRDGADTILEFHRRSGSSYLWNLYFKEISRLLLLINTWMVDGWCKLDDGWLEGVLAGESQHHRVNSCGVAALLVLTNHKFHDPLKIVAPVHPLPATPYQWACHF